MTERPSKKGTFSRWSEAMTAARRDQNHLTDRSILGIHRLRGDEDCETTCTKRGVHSVGMAAKIRSVI